MNDHGYNLIWKYDDTRRPNLGIDANSRQIQLYNVKKTDTVLIEHFLHLADVLYASPNHYVPLQKRSGLTLTEAISGPTAPEPHLKNSDIILEDRI